MPQFTYTAIGQDNQRVTGTIEAFSLQAARDALKAMHLVSEEIHESPPYEPLFAEPTREPSATPAARQDPVPAEPAHSSPFPPVLPDAAVPPVQQRADQTQVRGPLSASTPSYFPLLDTLRLYAGWLLAWYCLVYALGSYQYTRPLPFRIPYVEGLFLSPLVLSFTFAAYLFLLLSGLWKATGKKVVTGLIFTTLGIAGFVLYRMNVL